MSFREPLFLLALLAVPLLLGARALARRRARPYAARFPGVPTLAAVIPAVPLLRRVLPAALLLCAVAAVALALARPQATVAVPVERATAVLVMDSSRSMLADDVDPSRLDAAQQAGRAFLDAVPGPMRVGVVGFADTPHTIEPPTDDRERTRSTIDELVADGGTGTGEALEAALALAERDTGKRARGDNRPPAAILLLSDGRASTGRDPQPVAEEAGRRGIPVHTVALGTKTATVPGPLGTALPAAPDPEALRQIARASGGEAFTTDDAGDLENVYERLGAKIGTKQEEREITAGFAGAGALLLLLGAGLSLRWAGRLP
jgi:Ca-activated chloride channel family protein